MNKKQLGRRIKELRKQKGLSQCQLAALMGYKDHSTLAKVETGVNDITVETLYKYASALGVSVEDILFFDKRSDLSQKPKPPIRFKRAILDDATVNRLIELSVMWFNEDISVGITPNKKEDIQEVCYLALSDDVIVGYAFGHYYSEETRTSYIEPGAKRFDVDEIYVMKEYRSLGVGKKLFSLLEEEVKNNAQFITLPTSAKDYKKVLHFYVEELGVTFHSAYLIKKIA